jgi:hypothetical protein
MMKRIGAYTLVIVAVVVVIVFSFPTPRLIALLFIGHLFATKTPPQIAEGLIPESGKVDREEIDRKLTAVLEQHFPAGTSEHALTTILLAQGFQPMPPPPSNCVPQGQRMPVGVVYSQCYDPTNTLKYRWNRGLVCGETITVKWQRDDRMQIAQLKGYYDLACL